jgi:hypothetical protein
MTNIVNRLTFELECLTEEQAFGLRQEFISVYLEQINNIINKICSKYVSEGDWMRIDKLEIDLGEFSLDDFEFEFGKEFEKKLDNAVYERVTRVPKEKLLELKANSELDLIEFFLLRGHLPWWGDESTLDLDDISRSVFKNQAAAISGFFMENQENRIVWERASFQLKEDVLDVLVQMFEELHKAQQVLDEVLELIKKADGENGQLVFIGEIEQFSKITSNILVYNAPLIFAKSGKAWEIKLILADYILKKMISLKNQPGLQKSVSERLFGTMEKEPGLKPPDDILQTEKYIDPEKITASSSSAASFLRSDASDTEDEKKLTIRHAGIILLAPYLKTFFCNTGLLSSNSWKDKEAQFRSIFLLKYLSSGKTKGYEYQLILEKLLCGIPLLQPVPSEMLLTDNEIKESDSLLESVIGNWKALKNTSIAGIRETFLKRDGIITETDSGWHLRIERKTVDVILDQIPWGFSNIRLPWNKYSITTEW